MCGSIYADTSSQSPRLNASVILRTSSTFSCEIRLLLEAEVGEGAVAKGVQRQLRHFAVGDVEQACSLRRGAADLQTARLAASDEVVEHEHALGVQLAKILGLRAEVVPVGKELAPSGGGCLEPSQGLGGRAVGRHELKIGTRPSRHAEVAPFPVRVDRAHEVQVLGHRLSSLRGKAFGCCAGLVDVAIVREANDQAVYPFADERVAQPHLTAAPDRTGFLGHDGKADPVAEVKLLLRLDLELLVAGVPVFPKAADRNVTLEGAQSAQPRHVPDGIGRVAAQYHVKVPAISSGEQAPPKLDQIGGRGLLGHRPSSIPLLDLRGGYPELRAAAHLPVNCKPPSMNR